MAIWPNKDILSILGSPLAGDGVSIVEPRLMVRPVFVVHQPDESCDDESKKRRFEKGVNRMACLLFIVVLQPDELTTK